MRAVRGLPTDGPPIGHGRPFAIGTRKAKIRLALSKSPYTYQGVWDKETGFASDVADAILEDRPSNVSSTINTLIASDIEDLLHCLGIYHEEIEHAILWQGVYLVPHSHFRRVIHRLLDPRVK